MNLRRVLIAAGALVLVGSAGSMLLRRDDAVPDPASAGLFPAGAGPPVPGEAPLPVAPPAAIPAGFLMQRAATAADVREVLRVTREATLEDSAALLDAALNTQDPLVAGNALEALGRLKAFTSNPALLGLISDPRLRVRQDAVIACGIDGDAAALPHLERALAADDPSLRPLILHALGQIGGPRARAMIQAVLNDATSSSTDRVFARAALTEPE